MAGRAPLRRIEKAKIRAIFGKKYGMCQFNKMMDIANAICRSFHRMV